MFNTSSWKIGNVHKINLEQKSLKLTHLFDNWLHGRILFYFFPVIFCHTWRAIHLSQDSQTCRSRDAEKQDKVSWGFKGNMVSYLQNYIKIITVSYN